MPEIKPANLCAAAGCRSSLKTSCTCHMCPVIADLSRSSLNTCGRARHTYAPAARYYVYVNISYLLLDLHGVTDKTDSVCAACQRPPIYFFPRWSLLQDC